MAGDSIISQPSVTINVIPAAQTLSTGLQRVLIVGQMTTGTATEGVLETNIGNANEQNALFGQGSILANSIAGFKSVNQNTIIDAIAGDDSTGNAAASGDVTFTGAATEAGTFTVAIGSIENATFSVPVASGDSATSIGDDLETLITANLNCAVTAVNTAGAVALTAKNTGTVGNAIGIKVTGTVAGVTVAISAMGSGTGTIDTTTIFDTLGETRYQTIIWPFEYGLSALTDFLDPRFNVTNLIQDGIGIASNTDTFSNLQSDGTAENSQSLIILGNASVSESNVFEGSSLFELDYVIASQQGGARSKRLTEGTNISSLVIATSGGLDTIGGPALASMPYFNTPFPNLPLIDENTGFDALEIEQLGTAGVSVLGQNRTKTTVISGEIVTTYKTDAGGNPDTSFKFANSVDTISTVREVFFNNIKSRFAQTRLTEGDVVEGHNMVNEPIIRAFLRRIYDVLSGQGFVCVQAGETAQNFFNDELDIALDLSTGTVTVTMVVPIVTQLRAFNVSLQLAFTTES